MYVFCIQPYKTFDTAAANRGTLSAEYWMIWSCWRFWQTHPVKI